ncbi:LOW QUALITY PROTEIN: baculoviral IAP repeat-containing protein 1e-like, partial [Cyanocitta cristata]
HVVFDFHKFVKYMDTEFQEVREQLQRSNPTIRNKYNTLKSFLSNDSSWSLTEMATAAFFHTLVQSSMQCFCCGLVLFTMMVRCTPCEQHKRFCPPCEFVLGKSAGNISKYGICVQKTQQSTRPGRACRMQSFGRLFCARGTNPDLPARAGFFFRGDLTLSIFEDGGVDQTFKTWLAEAHVEATAVTKARRFTQA